MSKYEVLSIIISTSALFLTLGGLIYAAYQIKLAREQLKSGISAINLSKKVHQENHDWNRRMAAQEAIVMFRNKNKTRELREALGQIDINDAIPLQLIHDKFKTNSDLQSYIHSVLNTFEGYARGISQGIYDEEVIKTALKGTMVRYFSCFHPYIKHIRDTRNPDLFNEFEGIVNKWRSESTPTNQREITGN